MEQGLRDHAANRSDRRRQRIRDNGDLFGASAELLKWPSAGWKGQWIRIRIFAQ